MYGKSVDTPRLLYAMKDDSLVLGKSYKFKSGPWTEPVLKIKKEIENLLNIKIKYAQLNYY